MKLKIKRWGINGEGIAYVNKKAIFVEGGIVGEVVDAVITEDKGTYAIAQINKILEESPRRRHPLCSKSKECGGCPLIHVDYKGQLRMKEESLRETLRRYTGYEGKIEPIIKNPNPLGYRNACKLPVEVQDGKIISGIYTRGTNDLIEVERCIIHSKKLERVRQELMHLLNGETLPLEEAAKLKNLVLKEFDGKVHVIFVTQEMTLPSDLIETILNLEDVASVWQSVKEPDDSVYELFGKKSIHLGGEMKMSLNLDGYQLSLLPRSFFQLNTEQAKNLYRLIREWLPDHSNLLVEAYSGIGAISLYAADKADEVVGIEYVEDAVANANDNAMMNGKENVHFFCGDAAEEMEKIAGEKKVDALVVDPPRSGLNTAMKEAILKAKPETIIYVSCNPSTLGKDLEDLSDYYRIDKVQPFDFFSQTSQVETAVLLRFDPQAREKNKGHKPVRKVHSRASSAPRVDLVRNKDKGRRNDQKSSFHFENKNHFSSNRKENADKSGSDRRNRKDRPAGKDQKGFLESKPSLHKKGFKKPFTKKSDSKRPFQKRNASSRRSSKPKQEA